MIKKGEMMVRAFDAAAQAWGWQSDQGHDSKVISRTMYTWRKQLKELIAYVKGLEDGHEALVRSVADQGAVIREKNNEISALAMRAVALEGNNQSLVRDLAERDKKVMELTEKLRPQTVKPQTERPYMADG